MARRHTVALRDLHHESRSCNVRQGYQAKGAALRASRTTSTCTAGIATGRSCASTALFPSRSSDRRSACDRWLEVPPPEFNFLAFDEAHSLIAAADDDWRAMITIAVRTGLRLGELLALRWSDVDLQAWTAEREMVAREQARLRQEPSHAFVLRVSVALTNSGRRSMERWGTEAVA